MGGAVLAASDRCARLSRGQLEVLHLVNRHLSSKEIAAELGISSHTVDQRVRGAIRTLGVARRSEAARLVAMYEQGLAPSTEQRQTDPHSGSPMAGTEVPPRQNASIAEEAVSQAQEPQAYQRLIHQPPYIDAEPDQMQSKGAVSSQIRHADRTGGTGTGRLETEQSALLYRSSLLPWSTSQQVRNDWGVGQRLVAIVGIAIMSSLSVGMLLAGLESLTRLLLS